MRPTPGRIAAAYVVIAATLILLAGPVVDALPLSDREEEAVELLKGAGFVALTGSLLLLLIRMLERSIQREREASERLEREIGEILARIGDGFVAFDRDWRYTYVNARAGELLGRRPEDLVGRIYHEEYPEAVGTPFQLAYARAMEEQVALVVEERYAPWDRWFENRIYPSADGIAILFSEITDRKLSELAIRESERRMRSALEELPMLGVLLDTEGRITFCNDFLLDLTGWTREEVLGREWLQLFIPPEVRTEVHVTGFARSIEAGAIALHHENEIVTRQSARRLVAWNNTILRDVEGRVTGTASVGEDITERRHADRALLEAQDGLIRAEEQGGLGSWRLEVATGRESWSRQMHLLFGFDPGQGPPDPSDRDQAIHPDDRLAVQEAARSMAAGIDPELFIVRTNPALGPVRFLSPSYRCVRDDAGRPVRHEVTLLDVTERELAERELRAAADVLRRTSALARVGGWALEVPSLELTWTEEVDRIHEGAAAGSPTLELALSFYPPESRPVLEAAIDAAINSATPWDLELQVVTASGRRLWVHSIGSPVLEDGAVVRLVGATQDITERRAAQDEARSLLERLTLATQAAGAGIFDWDLVTDTWYGSPSYFEMLGYDPEPGSSEWRTWLDRFHPDDRGAAATRARAALAGSDVPYEYEARVRHADGSYRWVRVTGRVTERGEDGRPRRIMGIRQDISDQVILEAGLRQAQKMEALGQFAGILAHDVRSYFNAIGWSADALATDLAADDPRLADALLIRRAVDEAQEMISSILEYARPTSVAGRTDLAEHVTRVGGILDRLVGPSVRVVTDIPPGVPAVALVPALITQVLINMAVNARDAMPDGGMLRISAREREQGDDAAAATVPCGRFVRLAVADTGAGMDPETARRAFDAFYTTKRAGDGEGGVGLGLASVYLSVARAGGSVAVSSEPGRGTTFMIDLPVAE